jgi:hypothetical protein
MCSDISYYPHCYAKYLAFHQKHAQTIAASFFGHVNLDYFYFPVNTTEYSPLPSLVLEPFLPTWSVPFVVELSKNYQAAMNSPAIASPIFVSPSAIPSTQPTVRLFDHHSSTFEVQNHQTYYANLSYWNALARHMGLESLETHLEETQTFIFELEYHAKQDVELYRKQNFWAYLAKRLSGQFGSKKARGQWILLQKRLVVHS